MYSTVEQGQLGILLCWGSSEREHTMAQRSINTISVTRIASSISTLRSEIFMGKITAVFWVMTSCSLVCDNQIEEYHTHTAAIFHHDDRCSGL
jgi:hypothetical protein